MNTKIRVVLSVLIAFMILGTVGCSSDADVASRNLSVQAEMFRVMRRVVFYNGITGEYILVVEGRCSIEADTADGQLELTCKTGPNQFKKHFLGLSDNVTYFAEQMEDVESSVYRYDVIFKPQSIVPDVELSVGQ